MAAVNPNPNPTLFERISVDLAETIASIHENPDASRLDQSVTTKNIHTIQRVHNEHVHSKLTQLAETLKKSPSAIDHLYRDRVINALVEFKTFSEKSKHVPCMFEKAIHDSWLAFSYSEDDPRKQAAQKAIQDALTRFSQISSEYNIPLPKSPVFVKEYTSIHTEYTSKKEQLDKAFLHLPEVFKHTLSRYARAQVPLITPDMLAHEPWNLLYDTAELVHQEKALINAYYMMSDDPIQEHTEFLNDIIARASAASGVDKNNIQDLERRMKKLANGEPEFRAKYNVLWRRFVTARPYPKKIIQAAKLLGSEVTAKANKIIDLISQYFEEINSDTAEAASICLDQKKCKNPRCPSQTDPATSALAYGRFKCSRCMKVYYCGEECQVADWPRHKKECFPPQTATK